MPKQSRTFSSRYSPDQEKWCTDYERLTGFPAQMEEYEQGYCTFKDCANRSVRWYESHSAEVNLKLMALSIPSGLFIHDRVDAGQGVHLADSPNNSNSRESS